MVQINLKENFYEFAAIFLCLLFCCPIAERKNIIVAG